MIKIISGLSKEFYLMLFPFTQTVFGESLKFKILHSDLLAFLNWKIIIFVPEQNKKEETRFFLNKSIKGGFTS